MKRVMLTLAVVLVVGLAARAEGKKVAVKKETGGYVHVVLFKMKKDTTAKDVEAVVEDCHKMLAKIKAVRSVKVGRPAEKASPRVAKKDYDLALLVLVDDADGLTSYLDDPLHLAFVKKHGKNFDMEKLRVFDFMNQKK